MDRKPFGCTTNRYHRTLWEQLWPEPDVGAGENAGVSALGLAANSTAG
jgi:hypothetical protein